MCTASSHTPQATDVIGTPRARPCSASASRAAFAAAYAAWSPLPQNPAMDEKRTNASNSPGSSDSAKCAAPATLAASTASMLVSDVSPTGASSMKAAACSTVRTVCPSARSVSSRAATASRSATSQAATVTPTPRRSRSLTHSEAPGAAGPDRLTSTRCSAPWVASQSASRGARLPVPPVISTVPRGRHRRADRAPPAALTIRRASNPAERTATWSSPVAPDSTCLSNAPDRASRLSGRSTNPPHNAGCSRATTRPSPQTCACAGSAGASESPVDTAPRVTLHSGARTPSWLRACTRVSVRAAPVASAPNRGCGRESAPTNDSTPAASVSPSALRAPASTSRSRAASASRSASASVSSTGTIRAPWPPSTRSASVTHGSASCPAPRATSQVPVSGAGDTRATGFQAIR